MILCRRGREAPALPCDVSHIMLRERIAVVAAGAHTRAAGHGIPGIVGPMDAGLAAHVGSPLSCSYSPRATRGAAPARAPAGRVRAGARAHRGSHRPSRVETRRGSPIADIRSAEDARRTTHGPALTPPRIPARCTACHLLYSLSVSSSVRSGVLLARKGMQIKVGIVGRMATRPGISRRETCRLCRRL